MHGFLLSRLNKKDLYLLDIGAAEGYYTVGTLFINRTAVVAAFEMNPDAQRQLIHLAKLNGVLDRVELFGECNLETLHSCLKKRIPDMMIMDVEGAEFTLVSENVCQSLRSTDLVIEVHPWVHRDLDIILRDRLKRTHNTTLVAARQPHAKDIELSCWRWLAKLHHGSKVKLLHERPDGMSWIIATPK